MLLKRTALATALTLTTSSAMAVSQAEFDELKAQFEAMAEAMESNVSSGNDVSIGGYGELHYNNFGDKGRNEIDFHRFVLYFNYEFNDKVRLFTELELEHSLAGEGKPGEVELEQAYIQVDLDDYSTINAGLFLMPVGILNETHEPDTFYGVERNPVEARIIPTTWWEAGVMYSGRTDSGLSYDVALHSGLQSDPTNFSIRGGRQKVAEATAEHLATTARIKYTGTAGLELAATLHRQNDITQVVGDGYDAATLLQAHARWNSGPIGATAFYAMWDIDGAAAASTGADEQTGMYFEANYRINDAFGIFARQSIWDETAGSAADTEKTQTNAGVNYWVHEHAVFKFDIQSQDVNAGDLDGFNLGVGYSF